MEVVEIMVEEDISQLIFLLFTSYFSLPLIFLLFFEFQKNLNEIRIWRSFLVFEESMEQM